MTINSRMWGVSWRKPEKPVFVTKRKAAKLREEDWREMRKTGLPSIPGRTARLKAIYLLQIAAEVEHALMVQYLYAAYAVVAGCLTDFGNVEMDDARCVRWRVLP